MQKILLGLAAIFFSTFVAATGFDPVQNIQPPRGDSGKIEIESVFWYGCPYCLQLEPHLKKLSDRLPDNAELINVPAPLNPSWALHARAYHVAAAFGIADKLHLRFFREIQNSNGRALNDLESLVKLLKRYGIDEDEVRMKAEHPAVISAMRTDAARLTAYGLRQVPAIIVGGKYIVTSQSAGGIGRMADAVMEAIVKIQQE